MLGSQYTVLSVHFSSVAQSCPTLCNPRNCSTLGFPVHHQLPELAQTHIHQVSDAILTISSSVVPFSSCLQSSPASVFSNELVLHIRWPKYWSFSFNISPSNEHPGLISFRMDWFDLLAVQVTVKNLSQHHSSKTSIFQCSAKASHVLDPDKMDEFSNYFLLWLAVYTCMVNSIWLFVTPWTIACQAPLSMGFSRKEYCNGLPFSSPGVLPNPWMEPGSPALQGRFFTTKPLWKPKISESHSVLPYSLWPHGL